MFPGGEDMQQLLAHAQQLQEQLMAAQERLENTIFEGDAGGGLVKAKVNGAGELLGLDISPEAVDPADTDTLADLVVAAVRAANTTAEQAKAHALGPLAEGLGFGGPADPAVPGGGGPGSTVRDVGGSSDAGPGSELGPVGER